MRWPYTLLSALSLIALPTALSYHPDAITSSSTSFHHGAQGQAPILLRRSSSDNNPRETPPPPPDAPQQSAPPGFFTPDARDYRQTFATAPTGAYGRGRGAMVRVLHEMQAQLAATPPQLRDRQWEIAWQAHRAAAANPQQARHLWTHYNAERRAQGLDPIDAGAAQQRLARAQRAHGEQQDPALREQMHHDLIAAVSDDYWRVHREQGQREEQEQRKRDKNRRKRAKDKERKRERKAQQEEQGGEDVARDVSEQAEKLGALKIEGPSRGQGEGRSIAG